VASVRVAAVVAVVAADAGKRSSFDR